MKGNKMKNLNFRETLRVNIRKQIAKERRNGTVLIGVDCLKQCVPTPSTMLPGAPLGTNAQWAYAQMFRDVCRNTPDIAAFVMP